MTPQKIDPFHDRLENQGIIVAPGEGESLDMNGMRICLKVTSAMSNDQLGLYEISLHPGAIGTKLHYHRFMDETFVVTRGRLTVNVGNSERQAEQGTVIYVPRFTAHAFRNDSKEETRLMLLFNPAQKREGFFRGLYQTLTEDPIDPGKYLALYHKYDSYPVDTSDMLPVRGN